MQKMSDHQFRGLTFYAQWASIIGGIVFGICIGGAAGVLVGIGCYVLYAFWVLYMQTQRNKPSFPQPPNRKVTWRPDLVCMRCGWRAISIGEGSPFGFSYTCSHCKKFLGPLGKLYKVDGDPCLVARRSANGWKIGWMVHRTNDDISSDGSVETKGSSIVHKGRRIARKEYRNSLCEIKDRGRAKKFVSELADYFPSAKAYITKSTLEKGKEL